MEVRRGMRGWPVLALMVGALACADQGDDLDTEIDAVPPAAETTPSPTSAVLSEAEVVQAVTAVNQAEIEEAELARTKSENEQVRAFAEMMITDHTRMLEESAQGATAAPPPAGTPDAQTPGTATQPPAGAGTSLPGGGVVQQLEQESQQARTRLEGLTGADFDQAYIDRQVEAHQRALDLIESQLLPSAQDPLLRQQLEGALPVIQQHLQRAQEIQQQLGAGAPDAGDTTGTGGTSDRAA